MLAEIMKRIKTCPICGGGDSFNLFSVEKFPYFTSPVSRQDKKKILSKYKDGRLQGKLEPVACKRCTHVYLRRLTDFNVISELYSKYYSYPSALEGSFIPERDDRFVKIFKQKIGKYLKVEQRQVLEIGCYDGYVLSHLARQGYQVAGCDPSEGANIGRRFGVKIDKKFFSASDYQKRGLKYDAVIFRHFLEHVPTPVAFLKSLERVLTPGGIIIFEVPNIEFSLRNGSTAVFSFQHLQYFSRGSILRLLKESRWGLKEMIDTGENLIVVCSKDSLLKHKTANPPLGLIRRFSNDIKRKKLLLHALMAEYWGKGVVMWGAGGFSTNLLSVYGITAGRIDFIVDSDPNKWGMEYLGNSVPIKSPAALRKEAPNCVLICSMYAKQIIGKLKGMHYQAPVISLYPQMEAYNSNGKA